MNKQTFNNLHHRALVVLLGVFLHLQQGDAQDISRDSGIDTQHSWGLSANVSGTAGGVGISGMRYISRHIALVIGIGYSAFPGDIDFLSLVPNGTTDRIDTESSRKEATVYLNSRLYISNSVYALLGVSGRAIAADLKALNKQRKVTLGAVGFPLALGFEFGERSTGITGSLELGFTMFTGPGSDDFPLSLSSDDWRVEEKYDGASGLLVGAGVNFYFR